jgi:hypothetical protein
MVALQEDVPVVPVAIHGSQSWQPKPGSMHRVSVAWGEPLLFDGLPRGGRGYKEASLELEGELRRLWDWLVEMHARGRPPGVPPARAPRDTGGSDDAPG